MKPLRFRLTIQMTMILMAASTLAAFGVVKVAPMLERRARAIEQADNCAQMATNLRAKAKWLGGLVEQSLAVGPPTEWTSAYVERCRASMLDESRKADDIEASERAYRALARRPWEAPSD